MKLTYQGYNQAGEAVAGALEAGGRAEAFELLRRQSIFPTAVLESDGVRPARRRRATGSGSSRLYELAHFCRQLAILVSTHTPVVQALAAVERQTPAGPWRSTIADVRRQVEEGASLAEAMGNHPHRFDAVCRSMVAAGESGGMLDKMLQGLAKLVRQQLAVRRLAVSALIYPVLLIGVSVVVVSVMIIFVLPQFEGLFKTLQAPLPPTTKALMKIGATAREWWWIVVPVLAALITSLTMWQISPAGKAQRERALLHTLRVGNIIRSFATARIARLLGVLLQARVSMLDALRLTREATSNVCYAELLDRALDAVSRGQTLASVFADPHLVVPSVTEAVSSGERAGQIGTVLVQVSDFLDEDNEQLVKSLASLLEPIILTVLGLIVGFVAISMFLPLFDLTAAGGGGGSP